MPLIHLAAERLFFLYGLPVTNTLLTALIVSFVLILFTAIVRAAGKKSKLWRLMQALLTELLHFIDDVTGDRTMSKRVLPLIATFFVFIATANLLELLPGFLGAFSLRIGGEAVPLLRSPDSDLTTTLALALVSVFAIQFFSAKKLGALGYLRRFFDFANPLRLFLGFFELLSELIKVLSFSFRLFGNIFAGEVLLLVTAFLLPFVLPIPFMILEFFVGLVQAFIFSVLTLTFIRTSSTRRTAS